MQHVVERRAAAAQQVGGHFLEVRAGQGLVQVHRGAVGGHGQVLHGDAGGRGGGELLLRLLGGFLQALQRDLVLGQVDAVLVLDFGDQPIDDLLIPVIATEVVVAVGGLDLDGGETVVVLADLQQGDIEGAAAEVEDQDALVFLALLKAVGQSGCGRLVDDTQDIQAGDLAGVLGGLTLGIVEVCRAGDDGVGDGLAKVGLGVPLQLHQDLRGNLLRGPLLAVDVDGPVGAHVALDGRNSAVNVGHGLTLGHFADKDLAGLGEGHHGRRGTGAFGVDDNGGLATFKSCDAGIRGSQIDTNCACHNVCSFVGLAIARPAPPFATTCSGCDARCARAVSHVFVLSFFARVSVGSLCGSSRLWGLHSQPPIPVLPKLEPTPLNFKPQVHIPGFGKKLERFSLRFLRSAAHGTYRVTAKSRRKTIARRASARRAMVFRRLDDSGLPVGQGRISCSWRYARP